MTQILIQLKNLTQVTAYSTGRSIDGVQHVWQVYGYVGEDGQGKHYVEWQHRGNEFQIGAEQDGPFQDQEEAIGFAFKKSRLRDCYSNALADS